LSPGATRYDVSTTHRSVAHRKLAHVTDLERSERAAVVKFGKGIHPHQQAIAPHEIGISYDTWLMHSIAKQSHEIPPAWVGQKLKRAIDKPFVTARDNYGMKGPGAGTFVDRTQKPLNS
jgi:hypothetical protein